MVVGMCWYTASVSDKCGPKEGDELGVAQDRLRPPGAANMPVEADHRVGRGHHQVKIVRDQQDAAAAPVADIGAMSR